MKKEQVEVGSTYSAKVGTAVVPVRITAEKWLGDKHAGWVATNTTTGRTVRIKSAQRLRREVGKPTSVDAAKVNGAAAPLAEALAHSEQGRASEASGDNLPDHGSAKAGSPKSGKGGKGKGAKAPKAEKPAKDAKPKRTSALDAAAHVLAASKEPLNCKQVVAEMEAKGLWTSPGGKTPEATLYAAMIREIAAKGKESRFRKTDRGLFTAAKG